MDKPTSPEEQRIAEAETLIFGAELGDPLSVDLHGMDAFDARQMVEKFIDDAFMAGEEVIKIIHGRGSGALRETVHRILKTHPLVDYSRDAQAVHAVGGVTYAVLGKK